MTVENRRVEKDTGTHHRRDAALEQPLPRPPAPRGVRRFHSALHAARPLRKAAGLSLAIALVASTYGMATLAATLTITDPPNGSTVVGDLLAVTGMAPPNVRVVRDISFAPDQDTTSDSTGLWTMLVDLGEGENVLTFRIADDHSTEQVLVVYSLPD